jgi:hypothetical protein
MDKSVSSQYLFGGISGMCGVFLSHPLDTIKTHIQTGNSLSKFKPSISNFYKGLSIPLMGVGIEKAIVFGTYNYIHSKTDKTSFSIPLSGAIAGLTASLIVSPYERLKIIKQSSSQKLLFKDVINPRFLFKGLSITFTREVPGFAIYFTVYEKLKYDNFTKYDNQISSAYSFLYGGISGLTAWIFIYPQDKIKTIIQSNHHQSNHHQSNHHQSNHHQSNTKISTNYIELGKSIKKIVKDIYNKQGISYVFAHFYKGFSWAAGRAIILHSGTFCMMEALNGMNTIDTIY